MDAINWYEFVNYMERLLNDLKSFTIADAVKQGLPVSTTMKLRGLKVPDEITNLRTKTISETARIVDKMNRDLKGNKTTYEKDFERFLKKVIKNYLGKKTFSELRDEDIVPTPMVSKIRKNKAEGNYYLGTIEKIDNSISTKDQYSIIGGMLGDKDKRTRHGLRIMLATFLGVLFLLTGLGSYIYQLGNYNYYLVNNTTPIGSSLTFARSGAEITISDVWTDQNRDLTVVKLGYSGNARKLLSTQGKNYNLYMATKEKDQPKNLQMSYGMLSTDGDAFLFLKGKLDERAYQVFIANQVSLISGDTADDDTKVNVNEADSITKALSQYSMNDVDNDGVISFGKKSKPIDTPDNINFRINPYSDSTNVYQGSFLTKEGEVDYSKVVAVTSKNNVVNKLEDQLNTLNTNIKKIEATKAEYLERLQQNPDDEDSQESIRQLNSRMETDVKSISDTEKLIDQYKNADFDEASFGEMKTSFKYLTLTD